MDSHNGETPMKLFAFPARRSQADVIRDAVEVLIRSDRQRDMAFVATLLANLADGIRHGQCDGYAVTAALDSLPLDVSRLGASPGPRAS